MPDLHKYLKARFESVRKDLNGVLQRLNDADLTWCPREGMRTIADQLLEIANKEKETLGWVQTGTWPDDGPDAFDIETATLAEIKDSFASLRAATYEYIDSKTEAQLDELVPNPHSYWEGLRMTTCPISEILRNIAAHEWYHTAQLITYLWSRGDNPDDW